jgi:hypothetical protein
MQISEARFGSDGPGPSPTLMAQGHPWGPDMPEVKRMKIARKIAIVMATATMSVGLLGISAPAHADAAWYSFRR